MTCKVAHSKINVKSYQTCWLADSQFMMWRAVSTQKHLLHWLPFILNSFSSLFQDPATICFFFFFYLTSEAPPGGGALLKLAWGALLLRNRIKYCSATNNALQTSELGAIVKVQNYEILHVEYVWVPFTG